VRWRAHLPRNRLSLLLAQWAEPVSAAAAGLFVLLAAKPLLGSASAALAVAVGPRIGSSVSRLEPYCGFLVVTLCALGGIGGAVVLWRALHGVRCSWLLPLILVASAEAIAYQSAGWLALAVPLAIGAIAPLLYAGRVRPVPVARYETLATLMCIASEAACGGLGIWFPMSRTASVYTFIALLALPATTAVLGCVLLVRAESRARVACAGLPALALPFVGLFRNPTLAPTFLVAAACICALLLLSRFAAATRRVVAWTRRSAIGLAAPAATLWLLLPWRFRDMATGDSSGHESQHLGWLNSMSFGKWMMADAGFTYGPLREYALAALAMLQGGLTLEHFRIAYLAVNIAGLVCLVAAIRLVCLRQVVTFLVGVALLVTHSTIAYFLIYVTFGAFGWADAARAGLATLAIVVAIPPDVATLRDARVMRRRVFIGGLLSAVAFLYSHDFGVPAILATLMGIASLAIVRRDTAATAGRTRAIVRDIATYVVGIVSGLMPFLAPYAATGRLGKLVHGYRWAIAVSKGATPFSWVGGGFPLGESSFRSLTMLTAGAGDVRLGTKILDYGFGPAIVVVGLGHAVAALARRQFRPRTAVIVALALFQAMVLYYAFVIPDSSHIVNATTPGIVLLVALVSGGTGLRARVGQFVVPIGSWAAALAPALWLFDGSTGLALHQRLQRLAVHEERPSFGEPYHYEFSRAGDEHVGDELLRTARSITRLSAPSDPVYCATWMLGGGAEAFLSDRRNPTSFDKADEIASEPLQRQALSELQAEPPKLIVGSFFKYWSDDGRRFIEDGWHKTEDPGILERNPSSLRWRERGALGDPTSPSP
jgi:hypothetical protein